MRVSALVLASAAATSAFELSDVAQSLKRGVSSLVSRKNGGANCPAAYTALSAELTTFYMDKSGPSPICNPNARAAIRMIFHDCGAWDTSLGFTNGCDGSLQFEKDRGENGGLADIVDKAVSLASKYGLGVADTINFMGNHAIVSCPGGPKVTTLVGRKDATAAGIGGRLPDVHAAADDLYKLFQAKGFNAVDLAAILGAHSTSNQFGVDPSQKGAAQDTTPGVWDVKYYSDTTASPTPIDPATGKAIFVFPSDSGLAAHPVVGKEFSGFVNNPGKWSGKFADAMGRMALFGNNAANFVDCTGALPAATSIKRSIKAAGIMERAV